MKFHDLKNNPNDLPTYDEDTQLLFYVKDWNEIKNDYWFHYALGYYKKSFMESDRKLFIECSKGYSSEHLPQNVLMWTELPNMGEYK